MLKFRICSWKPEWSFFSQSCNNLSWDRPIRPSVWWKVAVCFKHKQEQRIHHPLWVYFVILFHLTMMMMMMMMMMMIPITIPNLINIIMWKTNINKMKFEETYPPPTATKSYQTGVMLTSQLLHPWALTAGCSMGSESFTWSRVVQLDSTLKKSMTDIHMCQHPKKKNMSWNAIWWRNIPFRSGWECVFVSPNIMLIRKHENINSIIWCMAQESWILDFKKMDDWKVEDLQGLIVIKFYIPSSHSFSHPFRIWVARAQPKEPFHSSTVAGKVACHRKSSAKSVDGNQKACYVTSWGW